MPANSDTANGGGAALVEKLIAAMQATSDPPLMLDARQAWRLCGLSKSAWYRLLSADELPPPISLPGIGLRWKRAELERWVEKLKGRRRTPVLVES